MLLVQLSPSQNLTHQYRNHLPQRLREVVKLEEELRTTRQELAQVQQHVMVRVVVVLVLALQVFCWLRHESMSSPIAQVLQAQIDEKAAQSLNMQRSKYVSILPAILIVAPMTIA